MPDIYRHQLTDERFMEFKEDFMGSRLVHLKSGVTRLVPEEDRNEHYICYEDDEQVHPKPIEVSLTKPAKGLDELVDTIMMEIKEALGT